MRALLARCRIGLLAGVLVASGAPLALGGELERAESTEARSEALPSGDPAAPQETVAPPEAPAAAEEAAVAPRDAEAEYDPLFDEASEASGDLEIFDPLEEGNRAVFVFNRQVDRVLWNPLTRGYRLAVPGPLRRAVRRAFINLNAPVYVVNHLLRLRPLDAAETLAAFAMNSTFGMLGFLNAAERGLGIELKPADLGGTLALAGVASGPYLIIPLLGPTTVRDGVGFVVERAFHPLTYLLPVSTLLMWGGGWGMSYREEAWDGLQALEDSSLDPYSVLRSAYIQARAQEIEKARSRGRDEVEPL